MKYFTLSIIFLLLIYKYKLSILYKYKRWKKLVNLVKTNETELFMIYYRSLQMLGSITYKSITDIFDDTAKAKKINDNLYVVSYKINDNNYKLLIHPSRGPPPILKITDENKEDMTDEVLEYMGPGYDWHYFNLVNKKFNPADFFNKDKLYIELSDFSVQIIEKTKTE